MTPTDLERLIEETARGYLHVREAKGKPNTGPEIDAFLAHVGQPPGKSYCGAFVCRVVWEAGMKVPVIPKLRRTAGALRLASLNPDLVITPEEAQERMLSAIPVIGIIDHGGGKGHALIALRLAGIDEIYSIEANTASDPTTPKDDRDGDGVWERTNRKFKSVDHWLRIA